MRLSEKTSSLKKAFICEKVNGYITTITTSGCGEGGVSCFMGQQIVTSSENSAALNWWFNGKGFVCVFFFLLTKD